MKEASNIPTFTSKKLFSLYQVNAADWPPECFAKADSRCWNASSKCIFIVFDLIFALHHDQTSIVCSDCEPLHDGITQECLPPYRKQYQGSSLPRSITLETFPAGQVAQSALNESLHVRAWRCSLMSQLFLRCNEQSWKWLGKKHSLISSTSMEGDFPHAQSPLSIFAPPLLSRESNFANLQTPLHHVPWLVSWFEPWCWSFQWNPVAEKQTQTLWLKTFMCSSWLPVLLEIFSCIINTGKSFGRCGRMKSSCHVQDWLACLKPAASVSISLWYFASGSIQQVKLLFQQHFNDCLDDPFLNMKWVYG